MEINGESKLLRIFISSTDKFKYTLLYEVIVFAAKRYGLAGVTVLRGIMGYGSSSIINSSKFWEITEKLPVVIEIVDESEKIEKFTNTILIPNIKSINKGCLITLEKANIILHQQGSVKKT